MTDRKKISWTEPPEDEYTVGGPSGGNGNGHNELDLAAETTELPIDIEAPTQKPPRGKRKKRSSSTRNVTRTSEKAPPKETQQELANGNGKGAGTTSNAAELQAEAISAWFGSNKVLENVNLHMQARTVTALIGPSGCGKSTFLRILNRMHELVPIASLAGSVLLDGSDIYAPDQRPTDTRRHIGMVFQKPNPFPAMSIYDNVLAGPKLTKTPVKDRDELVETSLRSAGLWNEVRTRLKDPGGGLSGGQQQRLCIARALAIRPKVLLMDEPCSALDPTSTRRIEETIDEISHEVTIVIVTHNMQQAQRVSHRCAFFLAGENEPGYIVEEGPTEQVFNNPVDPQTNDYVNGRFG